MTQFIKQTSPSIHLSKVIFTCIYFLFTITAFAQFSQEYNTFKLKYPDSPLVKINDETVIKIEIENGEIVISQEFLEETLYLNKSAIQDSKQSIDFSSFYELESVQASSYQYINGKYKEYKVEKFVEKDELDNSFYDDTKTLSYIYNNLSEGGKTKLSYVQNIKNPRFLVPFYFADFFPINKKTVTIIADNNIKFRFQEFNTEGFEIEFVSKEKRGKNIYSWEINNVDEFDFEANTPTYKNVLPHIIPIITSYKNDNKEVKVLSDVSDLYSWYYSLVKEINNDPPSIDLVAVTEGLIEGEESEIEKVRAIYYWAQQNIKYIDFEYGLGGFIPREANDVFNKKYGDCKDNSSILFEMLKIVGLEGRLTWIGTRTIPYRYEMVPTPIVDNHMILTYKTSSGDTYFLDATGRYLPLEMPSSFIQGKEALVSNGESNYEIVEIPIIEPEKNKLSEKINLKINNDILSGTAIASVEGYYKIDFFNQLESKTTNSKLIEYYNQKFRKGNNKFLIREITEKNKFDYDQPFLISYDFNITDYLTFLEDEIILNLNLNKDLLDFKSEQDRKNDVEVKYKSKYDFEYILEIPEGYKIEYLPEQFKISNPFLNASISYTTDQNNVIYKHSITMKYLVLNSKEQVIVNNAIKNVERMYKESVVLKKISK